jgi:hypothetical protein
MRQIDERNRHFAIGWLRKHRPGNGFRGCPVWDKELERSDDEKAALIRELDRIINDDLYAL